MSRKTGPVETPEYGRMVRRMLRAYGRRVADADPEDLTYLLGLRDELDAAIADAVEGQNKTYHRSWQEIARAAGVTRSAAYQRWGKGKPDPDAKPAGNHCPLCKSTDPADYRMTGCGLPCDDAGRWHERHMPVALQRQRA